MKLPGKEHASAFAKMLWRTRKPPCESRSTCQRGHVMNTNGSFRRVRKFEAFKILVGVHSFSVSFSLKLGHLATRTLGIYYKL